MTSKIILELRFIAEQNGSNDFVWFVAVVFVSARRSVTGTEDIN